jgi:2'-5' RNA ligase
MAMNPIEITQWLLEQKYSYSTIQIDAPPEIADQMLEWGKLNIPDEVLFIDEEDGGKGRETEIHITVKYGLTVSQVPEAVYQIAHTTKPFPILVGKVSLFQTNPKFDVVKCEVESLMLHRLNAQIKASVPNEDTYPDYVPHMTLAYVQKGSCDQLVGMDVFQDDDNEFIAYGMLFKGSGDEDDPARAKEVLLFSKVKQHQAVAAEIMGESAGDQTRAYAISMVEAWERESLSPAQMRQRLESGQWGLAEKYWYARKKYPRTFGCFVEHASRCIEALGDEINPQAYVDNLSAPQYVVYHPQGRLWWSATYGWHPDKKLASRYKTERQAENEFQGSMKIIEILPVFESEEVNPERYVDELQPKWVVYFKITDAYYVGDGNWSYEEDAAERYPSVDAARQAVSVYPAAALGEFEFKPVYPIRRRTQESEEVVFPVKEGMPRDPRNGPEKPDYKHADQPDPYKDMPFPAQGDRMQQFLRARRKKRQAKPVL